MSKRAIEIDHVSKEYRLGAIGGTTLRDDLQRLGAKLRGREDPTAKIGASVSASGERFLALDDVSISVDKGEALGIIGHNGAGKSTLLKLLSRVTAPTSGTISYNGRIASMLEVGTGFHPELTGRENVYMNGAILGMTKAEIRSKFDEIVAFAEMEKFIDTPVKRYSSGMYVKLAFAVAAHLDSEIMVMDEVLAVGDMKFQQKCLGRMGDAAGSEGRTVLYVSHNMNTIRQLCTRTVVLDHGRLVFDGDTEEAIGVYMDNAEYNESAFKDLNNTSRPEWIRHNSIHTESVEYVGKKTCSFIKGEPIDLKVRWRNEHDVNNLCVRLEVLRKDRVPVGTSILNNFYSGKAGENAEATLRYELPLLVEDEYVTCLTFYSKSILGNYENLDWVESLNLMVECDNGNDYIDWDKKQWGNIRFDSPHLLNMR